MGVAALKSGCRLLGKQVFFGLRLGIERLPLGHRGGTTGGGAGREGIVGDIHAGRGGTLAEGGLTGEHGYLVGLRLGVELNGGHHVELAQGLLHGSQDNLPDGLLVLELYLGFGGMDVDVDGGGVDREIQEERHLLGGRNQVVEGLQHGLLEIGMAHVAAIDKEILGHTAAARHVGAAHETGNAAQ